MKRDFNKSHQYYLEDKTVYGLIGVGIKKLVEIELGSSAWDRISQRADFSERDFIKTDCYDDSMIFKLVHEISNELGVSVADVLIKFGHYWVDFAISEGYGNAYKLGGTSFVDFLKNLNKLHMYVASSFPKLQPPHFQVVNDTGEELDLIYRSARSDLEPMVIGLIEALGIKFNKKISITVLSKDAEKTIFKTIYS